MKNKILILILSILTLTICITACTDNVIDGVVKSIEIVDGSVATECQVGDTLDFSGIKVKITYEDGTTKEIGYSDVQISPVDTSTAGEKTVTVTYDPMKTNNETLVKAFAKIKIKAEAKVNEEQK